MKGRFRFLNLLCVALCALAVGYGCDDASTGGEVADGGVGGEGGGQGGEGGAGAAGGEGGAGAAGGEGGGQGGEGGGQGGEGGEGGGGLPTLGQIAADTPELSTLLQLVVDAGLDGALNGQDDLTVFAPVNSAFDAVPQALLDTLAGDPALLTLVLTYHVVPGKLDAAAVIAAGTLDTLARQPITITDGDPVRINEAGVISADIEASNGFAHLIDGVLLPELPPPPLGTIAEVATADGRFTTLLAAVEAAGLTGALADPEADLTVFAPLDAAFEAVPADALAALLADVPALTAVLNMHLVGERLSADEIIARATLDSLGGETLTVENTPDGVRINGALVVVAGIEADNGIIHAIDQVIFPPDRTVVGLAAADGRFSTLVAALEAAELDDTLRGDGPFTVFAPTDAAFAALPEGTVESLLQAESREQLVDILTYHVYGGALDAEAVTGSSLLTMLNGVRAPVRASGGMVRIGGALISMTDVMASNGVIHVIDAVMLPPANTPEALRAAGFNTLANAIQVAGLEAELAEVADLTIFAPTDAAFALLGQEILESLINNPPALASILRHHVVAGGVEAAEVVAATRLRSLRGFDLFPQPDLMGRPTINGDARITATDGAARNGIIHTVNRVILAPTSVVDAAIQTGRLNLLVEAVEAANLVNTLADPDADLTVFAPTDAAFNALGEETLEAVLANVPLLTDILLHHVVSGTLSAEDVIAQAFRISALGVGLPVRIEEEAVFIGDARITLTDIPAPNGVIHLIDAVLLPPGDILTVAAEAGVFGTLLAAVDAAGLRDTLEGDGPFTVFAPTDAAFALLPEGTVESLLLAENLDDLRDILLFHTVPGAYYSPDVLAAESLPTALQGQSLVPAVVDGVATVNGVAISMVDVFARNGVIHVIDAVLLPPAPEPAP